MTPMAAHFVTFLSPGTFIAENTTKQIPHWDTAEAVEMAESITERHGAKPYGFYFTTRARADNELDSKVVDRSGTYYMGGDIETVEDVEAKGPSILLENMQGNGWDRVVTTRNGYQWTQPLCGNDVVLDMRSL